MTFKYDYAIIFMVKHMETLNKRHNITDIVIVVFVWIISITALVFSVRFYRENAPVMISFIDIGQGDSCLIQGGDDGTVLIDGGNAGSGYTLQSYLKSKNISKLNAVFISHFHDDHACGIGELIEQGFDIEKLYINLEETDSELRLNILSLASERGISVNWIEKDKSYFIGKFKYEVLAPDKGVQNMKHNDQSTIMRAVYNDFSVLFTGDAEKEEQRIVSSIYGEDLKSTILKVPHHGSKTAVCDEFIFDVKPEYAVISLGKDNMYKCPSAEMLDTLNRNGIPIWRTDYDGTIEFVVNDKGVRNISITDRRG